MLYRIPNDGNKVLFVHGWNGRSSQFYRIIELLSDEGYDITATMEVHNPARNYRFDI